MSVPLNPPPPLYTTAEARWLYADRLAIMDGPHFITRHGWYVYEPLEGVYRFLHEGPVTHVSGILWDKHQLRFVPCAGGCCAHLAPLERAELARYNDTLDLQEESPCTTS